MFLFENDSVELEATDPNVNQIKPTVNNHAAKIENPEISQLLMQ